MKKSGILVILLFVLSGLNAQIDTLPSSSVEIIKPYSPTLVDARKVQFNPEINDDLKIELDLSYSFLNKKVPVSFQLDPIAPAKIKGEPLVKLYNGYAVLGVGNALVPFGELYYTNQRSKKYAYGGHARFSNMREVNSIEGSDMSNLHVAAFGTRFWKKNTVDAKIGYDRRDFNYYGYHRIQGVSNYEIPSNELEQEYNNIFAEARIKSTKTDSFNLRYEGGLKFNNISNVNNGSESNVLAHAKLSQFKNAELYQLDVQLDYSKYESIFENTVIGMQPQISTIGDQFRVNAGLGVFINADTETDFHFYPTAELKYNVIEDVLVPYVGVKGEIRRVNYGTLSLENPFIAEELEIRNTNEKYNLYLGLRGMLTDKISFNVSGARVKTDDAYFYIQLPDSNRIVSESFSLVYDELNEYRIRGELAYRMNEKIRGYLEGQYISFDTKNQQEAWHRPELKIAASVEYNLMRKIIAKADLIYWGEQMALDFVPDPLSSALSQTEKKLDGIFDANLSFEYRYTKRLSAFVKFNNIGGINYEKYKDYPTQGFNVWGGLTYGFK